MNNNIKLYRVVLNILFYIFYVLIVSISVSFIFPTILVLFWQDVLDPTNSIFDLIQIAIIVLVLIFSLIFRKYFYLPIRIKVINSNVKKSESYTEMKIKEKEQKEKNDELSEELELDIKIGKEIK